MRSSRIRRRKPSPALQGAVRAGAVTAIAASVTLPFLRRRLKIPPTAMVAVTVAGPLATTILWPRSKKRDAVLFTQQMWAFFVSHELPYDDPVALERRLKVTYPIRSDRIIGLGKVPNSRLQSALSRLEPLNPLDRVLVWSHWLWFMQPHLSLAWILIRHNDRFPRAARQLAVTYDIGCAIYFLVPTAPPWWAAQEGYITEPMRRIMIEVGEHTWRERWWPRLFKTFNGNPWAAMPSLHFGTSLMAALLLKEAGTKEGIAGFTYAGTLGFALVYLGEHYVTDLIAGAALVAVVRKGEPLAEPAVLAFNRGLQRLERVANA